jgi:uncharacterized membrane protein YbhN (UPF0104 family)
MRRGQDATRDMPGSGHARLRFLLRVAVSLLLLSVIVWRVGVPRLLSALQTVSLGWVLAALVLGIPRLGAKLVRWRTLISGAAPIGWRVALRSMLIGIAGGMVTPSRLGQVSAAFFIPGGDRVAIGSMVFTDLAMDAAVAVVAAGPAAAYLWGGPVALWASLAGGAVLAAVAVAPTLADRVGPRLPHRLLRRLVVPVGSLSYRRVWGAFGFSVIVLGFNVVQFYLLLRAFQMVPFVAVATTCPLVFVALILPVTIAGFGVREVTAAALLARFGVAPAVAVDASLVLFATNVGVPALAGALSLWQGRRAR